jgi:hypothetical protein
MQDDSYNPHAYKPVMAGLFAGIVATTLNIIFDVIYRDATRFPLSEIINVATIIFITLLLLTTAGAIFAIMDKLIRNVSIIYIILFMALTVLCVVLAMHTHRSPDPLLTEQFRKLLMGIVIITGACASFIIPYLSKKESMFI